MISTISIHTFCRFLDITLTGRQNITSGKVYNEVITKIDADIDILRYCIAVREISCI